MAVCPANGPMAPTCPGQPKDCRQCLGAFPPPPLRLPGRGEPHGDPRGWLIHNRVDLGQELGPLGGDRVLSPARLPGRDMAAQGGRLHGDGRVKGGGQKVPAGVSQGSKMEELEGHAVPRATLAFPQCLLGPRGALGPRRAPDPIFPALWCPCAPCPAQFSVGCPAGGDVAVGLLPPTGSGCPSSGAQSMAASASASLAGGFGDGGVSRLWRRAGWGGSGGGTEGARLGAPAIRRGRALGLAACSGAAGPGAVLRGWATGGGGGMVGRAGAGRLPGEESWGGLGSLLPGSLPGAEGAVVPAISQAGGCRQIDGQAAPCLAPILETQAHTSFWRLFLPSFLHKGPQALTPRYRWCSPHWRTGHIHHCSPTSAGDGACNEGPDPGCVAPARGSSSRLVAVMSPAPFGVENGGMKAKQRRWGWGGIISQALCRLGLTNLCGQCRQSSEELVALWLQKTVWSLVGMPAGTWPQGPSRCYTENGASQPLVGHGGPRCEAPSIHLARIWPMAWGGMRGGHGESWDSQTSQLPLDLHLSIRESGGAGQRRLRGRLFH